MNLTRRGLTGLTYLNTVTDLLQRIRLEGAFAGLFEAADFQWAWRKQDTTIPDHQLFWFNPQGVAVACLTRVETPEGWENNFIYLPSATAEINAQVVPQVIAAITAARPSRFSLREEDTILKDAVEAAGFVRDESAFVITELVYEPTPSALPPGFHLTTRVHDAEPHHMIKRNGEFVARKLSECALYRPDLDMCIRTCAGEVAAYALFWMDNLTQVGLLEPMRTEAEYRRRGLAHYLIVEGVQRLRALGATSIRVCYSTDNPAATNLYHRAGFVDRFMPVEYILHRAHNNSRNEVPAL